ncbi:hypothetical protein [Chryseobacterium sp. OSA05B]|uniref:hypothetical protein n=1 Tax=Chryseobacterium sp. OSA05B TaxID=2862650 RepID=UPI001CBAAEDB|nr:hypothetical protein [Chryseobacterium sp. OSA05B]
MKNLSILSSLMFIAISCSNNGRSGLEINWGIVGIISFLAIGYFMSKKEIRAEEETRNLNEQVRNQRGKSIDTKTCLQLQ